METFSKIPWLRPLDVKDTDIVVYQVLWPGDKKTRGGEGEQDRETEKRRDGVTV